jgi:hypothetical protein
MMWVTAVRVTALVALVSAGAAAWSVRRAVRIDDPLPVPYAGTLNDSAKPVRPRGTRVNIAAAVSADPFNPKRQAPAIPYRLPGEADAEPAGRASRSPQIRLLGTVVFVQGGGFVTCQIGNERPVMVRVGEKIGNYTLKSVARGSAVFTGPTGETLQVAAPQPGR